jgi:hypothetical protein
MTDITRILPLLLERLDQGCLAFFAGAGIPASEAGLPGGDQLAHKMMRELGFYDGDETLPEVASRFEKERDRVALFDFLKGALAFCGDIRDKAVCPSYRMLLRLPVKTLVTTNFDNLIERTAEAEGVQLTVFNTDKGLASYRLTEQSLLKVHGDLAVPPDELVITSEDYEGYTTRYPQFSHRIKDIFHLNTVVFLGYALNDSNFIHLYRSVLDAVGGRLKRKSYAILASDPGVGVREEWAKQRIEIVVSTSQEFLAHLVRAHKDRNARAERHTEPVKIVARGKPEPPKFYSGSSPPRIRKAFAYFIARQKALLKMETFGFCTIDALLNTREFLDPTRRIGRDVRAKAYEISEKLRSEGYYPEVLPALDEIDEKTRRRKIEEANFCVILISSRTYEVTLNRLYGAVAPEKPLLVFLHRNFRSRLDEDLTFRGLLQVGADVHLFKTRDLASCALRGKLEGLLHAKTDSWLAKVLNL